MIEVVCIELPRQMKIIITLVIEYQRFLLRKIHNLLTFIKILLIFRGLK